MVPDCRQTVIDVRERITQSVPILVQNLAAEQLFIGGLRAWDGERNPRFVQQFSQVMEQIRSLIASGAYKPGDRVPTEKELAERFGIGRSSVREAIKILNYLGVLESRAALGTFVRERSDISAEALSWSLLLGDDDVDDLIEADFQFHLAIIHSSSNQLFFSLFETLRSFLCGEIKRSQDDYPDPAAISAEHRALLHAFESGSAAEATDAFDARIENIKRRLRSAAAANPSRGRSGA